VPAGIAAAVLVLCGCIYVVPGPAAAARTPLPAFRSPSGNISCFRTPAGSGGAATLHCAIARADYAAALQRRCISRATLDWHGWELGAATKGSVTCSGGILYNPGTEQPAYRTLAYGTVWRHAPFTCWSRRTGVTCRNPRGHGLFVARESWRAW
jgi:Family of unknown function (DUF6636)